MSVDSRSRDVTQMDPGGGTDGFSGGNVTHPDLSAHRLRQRLTIILHGMFDTGNVSCAAADPTSTPLPRLLPPAPTTNKLNVSWYSLSYPLPITFNGRKSPLGRD